MGKSLNCQMSLLRMHSIIIINHWNQSEEIADAAPHSSRRSIGGAARGAKFSGIVFSDSGDANVS